MCKDTEGHLRTTEVIFNHRKYSNTKRTLGFIYTALLAYFQFKQNYVFGGILVFTGIILGLIYFISKIYFYNEENHTEDIIYLATFLALLLWGIYTFYNL